MCDRYVFLSSFLFSPQKKNHPLPTEIAPPLVVYSEVTASHFLIIIFLKHTTGTIALCYQDARGHESDMNLCPDD